jgi:DNA-binding MarR family transcriptional regulator
MTDVVQSTPHSAFSAGSVGILTDAGIKAEIVVNDNNWPHGRPAGRIVLSNRKLAAGVLRDPAVTDAARAAGRRAVAGRGLDLGSLNDRAGYFVRRFQVWIFQDFMRTLEGARIRPAQYSVLVLIGANPGLSQSDLADALGIERARMVRLLDELERRGLTERLRSTRDRRSHALFLTAEGRQGLERIETLVARHEAHVTERLGAARRKSLIKLLKEFG